MGEGVFRELGKITHKTNRELTPKRHSLAPKLQKAFNTRRQVFRRGNKKMLTKKICTFL